MCDLVLVPVAGEYYVNRLDEGAPIPEPASGELWSLSRTSEETSIIRTSVIPHSRTEGPWSAFHVAGTLDFALTGILHRVLGPLAAAQVSVFTLATFDTDHVLVPQHARQAAVDAWRALGPSIFDEMDT